MNNGNDGFVARDVTAYIGAHKYVTEHIEYSILENDATDGPIFCAVVSRLFVRLIQRAEDNRRHEQAFVSRQNTGGASIVGMHIEYDTSVYPRIETRLNPDRTATVKVSLGYLIKLDKSDDHYAASDGLVYVFGQGPGLC